MNKLLRKRVLVVGGGGHFGRLLIDDIFRHTDCDVIVGSRRRSVINGLVTVVADLCDPGSLETALSDVDIAICAAGPFQGLPTTLAELCLRRGIHYLDLADDRNFVGRIHLLDTTHADNLPAICPGWSTVSALSGLLAQIGTADLHRIHAIYIHMAAGNRGSRGGGTIGSLLHSVGQRFRVRRDGAWQTVLGWSEPRGFAFPEPIGHRRGYLVDVPDHEYFPVIFCAETVEFRAGSELRILNGAVSALRWFVDKGMVRNWSLWGSVLQRASALFRFAGHDWGGVGVEVIGSNGQHQMTRRLSVVAHSGGQRIAVMPASVMTGLLASGSEHRGVVSPAHWLSREQLLAECEKRGFRLIEEEV